jgi:hypothetical protein
MRFSLEFESDETFDGRGLSVPTVLSREVDVLAVAGFKGECLHRVPWDVFAKNLAFHFESIRGDGPGE